MVLSENKGMINQFDLNEILNMNDYPSFKFKRDYDKTNIKFTQPVLPRSFEEEFDLPDGNAPITLTSAGDILMKGKHEEEMDNNYHKVYRSRFGNLLHLVKWLRPECLNIFRELSRFMGEVTYGHMVSPSLEPLSSITMTSSYKYANIQPSLGDPTLHEILLMGTYKMSALANPVLMRGCQEISREFKE